MVNDNCMKQDSVDKRVREYISYLAPKIREYNLVREEFNEEGNPEVEKIFGSLTKDISDMIESRINEVFLSYHSHP
jgi:hypothetical protein